MRNAMDRPEWVGRATRHRAPRPGWTRLAGLTALSGLIGCASPVRIVEPDDQPKSQAIERVTVQLTSDYRARSFRATLNGRDVTTAWFTGCGLTDGASICSVPFPVFDPLENRLQVEGDVLTRAAFAATSNARNLQPARLLFSHDELGRCHQPGPGGAIGGAGSSGGAAGGPSAGGGVASTPGFTQQCTPQFRVLAPEAQDRRIWLLLPAAPSRPVGITVTPGSASVRLQSANQVAAAGAPITITIPATDRRASFWIRGITPGTGPISLAAEAPGYARAVGQVCVPAPATGRC